MRASIVKEHCVVNPFYSSCTVTLMYTHRDSRVGVERDCGLVQCIDCMSSDGSVRLVDREDGML